MQQTSDFAASMEPTFNEHRVEFAYLFGSQARSNAGPGSDFDIAVYLGRTIEPRESLDLALTMANELEGATGLAPIEVIILDSAPLPLAGRVVNEGRVLYSTNEAERAAYESLTFRKFTDFDVFARALDDELIEAHSQGRR
jgi:predicted nucleotidyltransferase